MTCHLYYQHIWQNPAAHLLTNSVRITLHTNNNTVKRTLGNGQRAIYE